MFYKIVTHGPYRIRQTAKMAASSPYVHKAMPVGNKLVKPAKKKAAVRKRKCRKNVATIS